MASAIAVLVRNTLKSEFRRIDPASARIVLFDAAPRVLGTFSEKISAAARKRLESLGVEVRLGHAVDQIDADGVIVAGERVYSKTVIWTAGVAPSPAGKWLKAANRSGWPRACSKRSLRSWAIRRFSSSETPHRSTRMAGLCLASRRSQSSKADTPEN